MKIQESAEMYLETILVLQNQGSVRAVDIAKNLGFSRPSVSVAVHALEAEHYISIKPDGTIQLEEKGRQIAEQIYERHTVLSNLLEFIGVDKETADSDACKIEHSISDKSFQCLKDFFLKISK